MLPAFETAENATASVAVTRSSPANLQEFFPPNDVIDYRHFVSGEASEKYDAVYVSTPNSKHLEFAEAAAEQGKAVLCEKPMETTEARAERMVEVCEENDVALKVANRVQYKPSIVWARTLLQNDSIGRPVHVHTGATFDLIDAGGSEQWRMDEELAGGGVLMDIGVYPINTVRFLLDEEPSSVQSWMRYGGQFEEIERDVTFRLEFDSSAEALCSLSYDAVPTNHLRVVGTTGEIVVEWPYTPVSNATVQVMKDDQRIVARPDEPNELVELIERFSSSLTQEHRSPTGQDGLSDMKVIDSIYESASSAD